MKNTLQNLQSSHPTSQLIPWGAVLSHVVLFLSLLVDYSWSPSNWLDIPTPNLDDAGKFTMLLTIANCTALVWGIIRSKKGYSAGDERRLKASTHALVAIILIFTIILIFRDPDQNSPVVSLLLGFFFITALQESLYSVVESYEFATPAKSEPNDDSPVKIAKHSTSDPECKEPTFQDPPAAPHKLLYGVLGIIFLVLPLTRHRSNHLPRN